MKRFAFSILVSLLSTSTSFAKGGRVPVLTDWNTLRTASGSGIMQSIYAKEMCSCHFIEKFPLESCLSRALIGGTQSFVIVYVNEVEKTVSVQASPKALFFASPGPGRTAAFRVEKPELGCYFLR